MCNDCVQGFRDKLAHLGETSRPKGGNTKVCLSLGVAVKQAPSSSRRRKGLSTLLLGKLGRGCVVNELVMTTNMRVSSPLLLPLHMTQDNVFMKSFFQQTTGKQVVYFAQTQRSSSHHSITECNSIINNVPVRS
jgi:hypothetical protein